MTSKKMAPVQTGEPTRTTFILALRPRPGVDGVLALRAALKRLRRDHGLECVECRPDPHERMTVEEFEDIFEETMAARAER